MRNNVFSRSPFGRKAYAHGLHFDPALDRSPLEPPLPPDSPILARWSAVRNCLPPLAELLDVEIVLMSAGYCVGGTGTHRGGGCKMPEDTALTYSLRSGQSTMVLSPGEDAVCRAVRAGGWKLMAELLLRDGDYVPDGQGGLRRAEGTDGLLQRVLFQLSARRGSFPFLPELGSRLYRLTQEKPGARAALARQYAAEALAEESELEITGVEVEELEGDRLRVHVRLDWNGEALSTSVTV